MNTWRKATLLASLLLATLFANASTRSNAIRITILDSETHSVSVEGSDIPKNCDQANFDAYCNNSKTALLTNTLLVQEGSGPAFRIACTVESKWSRCAALPKGQSYDARREKHGMTVYYVDEKGKARSQLYALVETAGPAATVAVAQTTMPMRSAPTTASASPPASEPGALPEKARCNFSSTPAGAEITLDGKYVGNTPSEIGLISGTHVVVLSLPGFANWKRELTVGADSVVNVTATLQRTQP